MSYNKTTWTSGQKITANLLNHIEDGIDGLNSQLTNLGYDLVLSESFYDLIGEGDDPVESMTILAGNILQFCSQMEAQIFPLRGAFVINNLDNLSNRKTILPLTDLFKDQDENEITIYNLIFSDVKILGSAIYLIKISVIFRPPNTIVSVQYNDRFIAN